MIQYDPAVVQSVAKKLDEKANFVAIVNSFIGLIIGCLIGAFLFSGLGILGLIIGGVIGLIIGNEIGLSKSLLYRFQAQTLLAQIKIERNTSKLLDIASATNEIASITSEITGLVQDMTDVQSE